MRKNVAGQKIGAQLLSATDGSAFTGSVTVAVTIDAGIQATGSVGSGACTHEGGGYHTYSPSQAETNGDLIAFTFSGTGAISVTIQIYTRPTTGLLAPTIADRTLDISATGEAGIDWANVGSPTTALNLSGTTISTSQQVASVSGNIGGNVVGSVGSIATNGISAASIAASALNGKGDWNVGKTGYSLVQTFPANFASMAITVEGAVTAGTVNDKTGYGLSTSERNTLTAQIEAEVLNDATGGAVITTIANAVAAYFDSATLDLPPQIIATAVRNNLATELARIDVAVSTRFAAASYTAPPSAAAISTQVAADLLAAHGSGSWTTATGFATPTDVTNALNSYDPPTNAEMEARTLLAASYATASQATTINNLLDPEIANMKAVIDQLATMLQGSGPYKFTADALSLAPAGGGGGGGGDWNVDEKATIKAVLGIPATGTTPVTPTTGILSTLHTLVKLAASGAVGTVQISGTGDVKTLVFKDTDGTTTLATVQWNTATGARTRI